MKLLLDSHVFVWLLFAPEPIGPAALTAMESADRVLLSTASLWELTLMSAKGKLPHSPADLVQGVAVLGVEELTIEHRHLRALSDVDLPHGDPFDALLVAQATTDELVLLTADRVLLDSAYATLDVRR